MGVAWNCGLSPANTALLEKAGLPHYLSNPTRHWLVVGLACILRAQRQFHCGFFS